MTVELTEQPVTVVLVDGDGGTIEVTDTTIEVVLTGDGQDGRSVLHDPAGGRAPQPTDGVAGDFWINQATWQVWGPKTGAGWGSPTTLGGSSAYVHTQASASDTWTINHNLGFRPAVAVLNPGGSEIDAEIQHTSTNQTVVRLNTAMTGTARLT